MPEIPLYTSREDSRVGGINAYADGDTFGAGIGRAMQNLAGAGMNAAGALAAYGRQKKIEDEANQVANFSYEERFEERKLAAPSGADGFGRETGIDYENAVNEYVNNIQDGGTRDAVRRHLMSRKPGVVAQAVTYEFGSKEIKSKQEADEGLNTLTNKVRLDPTAYDNAVTDGEKLIASRAGFTADQKAAMSTKLAQDLASSRFDAMIDNATTPEELEIVKAQMSEDEWASRLAPNDTERLVNRLETESKSIIAGYKAEVTAEVESLKERSKDPKQVISKEEMEATHSRVIKYGTARQQADFYEVYARQEVYRTEGKLPPSEIRSRKEAEAVGPGGSANAIDRVVTKIVGVEGGHNYVKNPRSSARGTGQFTNGTWLRVIKKYHPELAAGKSNAEILALRADNALGKQMTKVLTVENSQYLAQAGIAVTEESLYLAHFAGPAGAKRIYRASDDTNVVDVLGYDVVRANPHLKGMTVADVKAWSAKKMGQPVTNTAEGTSQGAFVRNAARDDLERTQREAFKADGDMMSYAASMGTVRLGALDSVDAFAQRGRDAAATASRYEVPPENATPLTANEVIELGNQIKNGNSDSQLQVIRQLQAMGPGMYKAATRQLGQTNSTFLTAASLAADDKTVATAAVVLRGQRRLDEDKTLNAGFGTPSDGADLAFAQTVGASLFGLPAETRNSIFNAAKAHYAESVIARGTMDFDSDQFAKSVDAVLGGTANSPALVEINGEPTLVPDGMTADEFTTAIETMSDHDYVRMSADGSPPLDRFGDPISAADIEAEGKFRSLGGTDNRYVIEMADGGRLTTGKPYPGVAGAVMPYIFVADAENLRDIASGAEGSFGAYTDVGPLIENEPPPPDDYYRNPSIPGAAPPSEPDAALRRGR